MPVWSSPEINDLPVKSSPPSSSLSKFGSITQAIIRLGGATVILKPIVILGHRLVEISGANSHRRSRWLTLRYCPRWPCVLHLWNRTQSSGDARVVDFKHADVTVWVASTPPTLEEVGIAVQQAAARTHVSCRQRTICIVANKRRATT